MKKRVYTLYRVSTIGQVEKDDIPMQKEACHEFAERQGWEIVKEFSEKGVSGFKKSAKDRDQLQLLQQAAAAGTADPDAPDAFPPGGPPGSSSPPSP